MSAVGVPFLTAEMAFKRGMFRDEGLDLDLIRMDANVSITALSTGEIDYTMVFASVVGGALRANLPDKFVAPAGFLRCRGSVRPRVNNRARLRLRLSDIFCPRKILHAYDQR